MDLFPDLQDLLQSQLSAVGQLPTAIVYRCRSTIVEHIGAVPYTGLATSFCGILSIGAIHTTSTATTIVVVARAAGGTLEEEGSQLGFKHLAILEAAWRVVTAKVVDQMKLKEHVQAIQNVGATLSD